MSDNNQFENILPVAPLKIAALESCREFAEKVDRYLVDFRKTANTQHRDNVYFQNYAEDSYLIDCSCPRFGTGEAKGRLGESVRGSDLFIMVDICNYSLTYTVCGHENHMSPDDHYQDLKRMISAATGKAHRINVVMPFLYEGRQHRRTRRESLDCAVMLQELAAMGVSNVVTFDAHDPRVQNAVPLMGFDNVMPTYQVLKALFRNVPDISLTRDHFMIVSPDEGAMNRNMYYASVLGVDLGMFYKRRDYSRIVNGRNPIVAHEYLGSSVEGKDVFIADDIISSGESMLDIAYALKKQNAGRIFAYATYAIFTNGLEQFDKAYKDGIISGVLGSNLTYRTPELRQREWFFEVDVSKYIAYFIAALNHDNSVSTIIDPHEKIEQLLKKRGQR